MKLNMDSITYDNGNGGIEFLEKCLKLTQIREFWSVDDGPRWLMVLCAVARWMLSQMGCKRRVYSAKLGLFVRSAAGQCSVSGHYLQPAQK